MILDTLHRRGQRSVKSLYNAFQETGNDHLADLLLPYAKIIEQKENFNDPKGTHNKHRFGLLLQFNVSKLMLKFLSEKVICRTYFLSTRDVVRKTFERTKSTTPLGHILFYLNVLVYGDSLCPSKFQIKINSDNTTEKGKVNEANTLFFKLFSY